MTIRKGEPWGEAVAVPQGLLIVESDAAARDAVLAGARTIGLAHGDLARTMGGGARGRFDGKVVRAPVDLLRVTADGDSTLAVAHVVARRSWWRGQVVMAMNAQFLGRYDVAPRSHPNDGRVEVLTVVLAMPLRSRLQARRRAVTGTHLPHPQLTMVQVVQHRVEFVRPLTLWVDGVKWRRATGFEVHVEPDALTVLA